MEASDDSQFMAWQRRGYQHWAEQDIKTAATIFRLLGRYPMGSDRWYDGNHQPSYNISNQGWERQGNGCAVTWQSESGTGGQSPQFLRCFWNILHFCPVMFEQDKFRNKKRTTKTLIVKRIVFDNRRQHNCDDGGWGELCFQIPLTLECGSQGTGHHAAITVHPISRS